MEDEQNLPELEEDLSPVKVKIVRNSNDLDR